MILNSLKSNLGYATVTLDYDEIVKIYDALYECKGEKTKNLLSQFGALHSLTKEGALEELKTIWEIQAEQKESREKELIEETVGGRIERIKKDLVHILVDDEELKGENNG